MTEKENLPDLYDYSCYVTDNVDSYNLVNDILQRELGGDMLDSLQEKPSVSMKESMFKKYVLPYYRNPDEYNRLALLEIVRTPRAEIRVYNDTNTELLFVMPPLFCDGLVHTEASKHTQLSSIERIVAEAKVIRERAGYLGEVALANMVKNSDIIKTDEEKSNEKIAEILQRYGVTFNEAAKAIEATATIKEDSKDEVANNEGYIDEW